MITRPEPQQLNRELINQIYKGETGNCLVITGAADIGADHPALFCQSLAFALNQNSNLESIILDAVSMDVIELVCRALQDMSIPLEISCCNVCNLSWEYIDIIDGLNQKRNFYISIPDENKKKTKGSDHDFPIIDNRNEKKLRLEVNYDLAAHVVYQAQLANSLANDFFVKQQKIQKFDYSEKKSKRDARFCASTEYSASLESVNKFEEYLKYGINMLPNTEVSLIKNLIREYLINHFALHPEIDTLSIQSSIIDFFGQENSEETLRLLLSACPNLKKLILSEEDAKGQHIISFESLAKAADCWPKCLTELWVKEIYDVDAEKIKCIATIPALEILKIRSHNLHHEAAVMISQIKNIKRFEYVYIDMGIGEMSEESYESILSNPHLRFFISHEHQYSNKTVIALATAIKQKRHDRLTIDFCGIEIQVDKHDLDGKLVKAMTGNVKVNVRRSYNEEVKLMNKRNNLLEDYPEYESSIKKLFYQYGLYKYQPADKNLNVQANIYSELRKREIRGSAGRMEAFFNERDKIIPRLEKLAEMEDRPDENERFLSMPRL